MKIFIGPSGCDLVLEALRMLLRDAESERFSGRCLYPLEMHGFDDYILRDAPENRIRNIKSMIGLYEALKNSYTEEDLREKLLWMAKEE